MKKNNLIKLSIYITDAFLLALIILAVILPFSVTWYAEKMGRSPTLAATVMVTCYPCVPFAAIALFLLRKLLYLAIDGELISEKGEKYIKNIAICCIVIAVITLIAGKFYLPFWIVSAALSFIALLSFCARSLLKEYLDQKPTKNDN